MGSSCRFCPALAEYWCIFRCPSVRHRSDIPHFLHYMKWVRRGHCQFQWFWGDHCSLRKPSSLNYFGTLAIFQWVFGRSIIDFNETMEWFQWIATMEGDFDKIVIYMLQCPKTTSHLNSSNWCTTCQMIRSTHSCSIKDDNSMLL